MVLQEVDNNSILGIFFFYYQYKKDEIWWGKDDIVTCLGSENISFVFENVNNRDGVFEVNFLDFSK